MQNLFEFKALMKLGSRFLGMVWWFEEALSINSGINFQVDLFKLIAKESKFALKFITSFDVWYVLALEESKFGVEIRELDNSK